MRIRDILVLFGPLLLVTLVGGGVLIATVDQAMVRERYLEAHLLSATARQYYQRSLRLLVSDLLMPHPKAVREIDAVRDLEEHAFVHGFVVRAQLTGDTGPIADVDDPDTLRLWLPMDGGRRLVVDVDLDRLVTDGAAVTGGRVETVLVKGERRASFVSGGGIVVPLAPLVAPAQLVPPGSRLVLHVKPPPLEVDAWPYHPKLVTVVAVALLVSGFTSLRAAREHIGRRKLLREVEASRARFQDFTDIASDWYWELDADFRFVRLFGRFEQAIGLKEEEIIGRHYRDILAAHADPRSLQDPGWSALLTRAPEEREPVSDLTLVWRHPDGLSRVFRIKARPTFDRRGSFTGYRGTAVDETALVEAQEAVAHARDIAENALAFKTRFMAGVSHDLQQPLLSIGLFAGQLLLQNRPETVEDLARRIRRTAENASGMVMQLHELSRLETAAMEPQLQPVRLVELLDLLAEEFDVLCDEKNLCLRVICPADATVDTDVMALERILRNLLSNAVRYTSAGAVMVTVRRRRTHYLIQVWDTGRGIPENDLPLIFEENWRGGGADDGPGLGLGLAVVQRAAAFLGHPLRVASRVGRGTVFSLEVPKAVSAADAPPSPAAPESPPASGSARRSSGRCSEGETSR